MKLSKFNIYCEEEGNLFVYNTLSGGVLHLNEEYTEKFRKLKQDVTSADADLIQTLKDGKMLVPKTLDENKMVIAQSNLVRFSSQAYTLTLAPTMKCNFICPYCYEKNKTYPQMDRPIIQKIKSLFKNVKESHNYLSVAWYGGEPLLGFDIIRELSQEAIEIFGDNYVAAIVTNGFLLTPQIIQELEKLRIREMQITLDGPPEIHNARRCLPNGEDTFFVILNNIQKVLELAPSVKVTIRVNTDKENVQYVDEILDYLEKYGVREQVGLYLAPIDNINDTCNSSLCFNNTEFAKEQLEFIERNLEKGYNYFNLPHPNLGICGAVSSDNYVIDAIGDIYKCWDDVACPKEKIGNILDENISLNENLSKWLSYDIRENEECLNCSVLPLCMGGCPNHWVKNQQKKCIPIKENATQLIKVLYKLSKKK